MKKKIIKKSKKKSTTPHEFDLDDLRIYMKMSPREKLDYLEKMNLFLNKITPVSAKKIQQKLKGLGF